jgi:cobalt transporter subunit CbtB
MEMSEVRAADAATGVGVAAGEIARVAPALATMALGIVILFCVGFLQTPAVHNGAHDTRHANGFPCH